MEACVREACAVAIAEGAKVDPEAILTGMIAMMARLISEDKVGCNTRKNVG